MPTGLSDPVKTQIIRDWLKGLARDKIAIKNGVSGGAVSNTVAKWIHGMGFGQADELRELAVSMKKTGITASQCATGFRLSMMLNKLGINDENFEPLISEIYRGCMELGLTPQEIASRVPELLEFSRDVSLSKMSEYILVKGTEKKELEEEVRRLNEQIAKLKLEESGYEAIRDSSLKIYIKDLRKELKDYGIPFDDTFKVLKVIRNIADLGYETQKVIDKFMNIESIQKEHEVVQISIGSLRILQSGLSQSCSSLYSTFLFYNQTLSVFNQLSAMGFGLKELKFLWSTISEITNANHISPEEAINKFLGDIEKQYDNKLGFESMVEKLRNEVRKLNNEETDLRAQILKLPVAGQLLLNLSQRGINESDIVNIAELLKSNSQHNDLPITIEEIRSMVAERRAYGGIKPTIDQLNKEIDRLKKEAASLHAQKQELYTHSQEIIYLLLFQQQLFCFRAGSDDSLRFVVLALLSIIFGIMDGLNKRMGEMPELRTSNFRNLLPLVEAAKGTPTNLSDLRVALAYAIDLVVAKLHGEDALTDVLSSARAILVK